jgi:ABC-type transporter Mla MlaB component
VHLLVADPCGRGSSEEGTGVLRITSINLGGRASSRTLRLEGKLLGAWVDELSRACEEPTIVLQRLRLDLGGVTFVDSTGLKLLDSLVDQGATIVGCSGFIADLLNGRRR